MAKSMKDVGSIGLPLIIITVGTGWLLNTLQVIPDINWVWTLGLAGVGALTLILDGLNRVSIIVGPFFLVASVLSVLRQTQIISQELEVPCLVIVFGVLLLASRLSNLPAPRWILEQPPGQTR